MAALAGLTLFLGVYPDPILNPITNYVESVFPQDSGVLQLPSQIEESQDRLSSEQPSSGILHSGIGKPDNDLLNKYSTADIVTPAGGIEINSG
jgi:hypothetical protein